MLPTTSLFYIGLFAISALLIWYGSGLVVTSISSLSKFLKISTFTISFFILGIMTSLPEFMIGATAVSRGEPEIMVGNLIGATLVMFLLVIPLLAILGGKVKLPGVLHRKQLIFALATILAPSVMIIDRVLTRTEGIIIIAMYVTLFFLLSSTESFFEKVKDGLQSKHKSQHRLVKLLIGVVIIFVSARGIVNAAEHFALILDWSPFVVGLLIVAIGTNIPELSLVIRTIVTRKTDIALADYIGSAAANSMLIGVFILASGSPILVPDQTVVRLTILLTSIVLFYIFIRSKSTLSRKEGLVLLFIYLIFFMIEITQA